MFAVLVGYLVLGFFICTGLAAVLYLRKKIMPTTGTKAMSNGLQLQGVVRGFRESRQSMPRFNYPDLDLIVWSFQLERHSETEERLDPIPVEMRGKYFSGSINEGNVVRLYEKSWHGGIVRTKRVYNVTFTEDILAYVETGASGALIIVASTIPVIGIILFILFALYFLWLR
jgi:hypothetical protein